MKKIKNMLTVGLASVLNVVFAQESIAEAIINDPKIQATINDVKSIVSYGFILGSIFGLGLGFWKMIMAKYEHNPSKADEMMKTSKNAFIGAAIAAGATALIAVVARRLLGDAYQSLFTF